MEKENQKKLTQQIITDYRAQEIKTAKEGNNIEYLEPIVELSPEQSIILNEGDGQSKDEYKQVNSSTGLAVNYYKILETLGNIEGLIFEDKIARPLKRGGKYANLDVSYTLNGVECFVESKFLEPYYLGNETNKEAYFNPEKYDKDIDTKAWIELFSDAQKYKVYNFSQLCRHLLAIYKYTHGKLAHSTHKKSYNGGKVCLRSVIWYMTPEFLESIPDTIFKEQMAKRLSELKAEAKKCQQRINKFIDDNQWSNMTFEALGYDEILKDIEDAGELYEEFKKRYFFNK